MRYRLMRFPGGKAKAVTFSYDDGDRGDLDKPNCQKRKCLLLMEHAIR